LSPTQIAPIETVAMNAIRKSGCGVLSVATRSPRTTPIASMARASLSISVVSAA
jgi:hypothetical protein